MRDDVVLLKVAIQVSLSKFGLFLYLVLLFLIKLPMSKSVSEELHVCPRSPNVLFDLLPNDVIFKVLVPKALVEYRQRVIIDKVFIIIFRILHIWNHNKHLLQPLIRLQILLHSFFPF